MILKVIQDHKEKDKVRKRERQKYTDMRHKKLRHRGALRQK